MARGRLTLGEPSVRRRLLTGGTIWSGAACSPHAGWVLVEDDRIAAVGEASERGAALPSPIDERLDLSGCHVLPGFVDVHLHLSQAAWFPLGVDGLDWASRADCLHAVRVQAAADPAAPWLLSWRVARWRRPGWPRSGSPAVAVRPASAATSAATGGAGPPESCGRRRTRSRFSVPSPTWPPTPGRRAPGRCWRLRRPGCSRMASPTPMTRMWRRTGTGRCSPCALDARCGCRGPPVTRRGCRPGRPVPGRRL